MRDLRVVTIMTGAALLTVGMTTVASAANPALNVLFYGNSFTQANDVPNLFSRVATAGGQTAPSYVNAAVSGQTLQYHYLSNLGPISSNPQSGKWDFVILQEYSTRPIDATSAPNYGPSLFLQYAQLLYNAVQANSPNVKPVLFETWARQPGNSDLHTWYPTQAVGNAPNQYMAAATQMQSELRKYYYQASAQLGNCDLAPVGDAFEALKFDSTLYQSDLYHESGKGSLMAALQIYQQVYNVPAKNISYAAMNSNLSGGLAAYGITDDAAWQTFVSVPEPTALGVMLLGTSLLLRRRGACRVPAQEG